MTLHIGYKSPFRTKLLPTNLSGNGLFLYKVPFYGLLKPPAQPVVLTIILRHLPIRFFPQDGSNQQSPRNRAVPGALRYLCSFSLQK